LIINTSKDRKSLNTKKLREFINIQGEINVELGFEIFSAEIACRLGICWIYLRKIIAKDCLEINFFFQF